MKTYQEILLMLYEAISDQQIYKVKNVLWVAYAQGSGLAVPINKKTYITDKKGDKNYEPDLIKAIVKATKGMNPVKKKKNSELYYMPVYTSDSDLSVWGGDNRPQTEEAFIIDKGAITVVTLFSSKKEAQAWMKSIS